MAPARCCSSSWRASEATSGVLRAGVAARRACVLGSSLSASEDELNGHTRARLTRRRAHHCDWSASAQGGEGRAKLGIGAGARAASCRAVRQGGGTQVELVRASPSNRVVEQNRTENAGIRRMFDVICAGERPAPR